MLPVVEITSLKSYKISMLNLMKLHGYILQRLMYISYFLVQLKPVTPFFTTVEFNSVVSKNLTGLKCTNPSQRFLHCKITIIEQL